MRLKLHRYIISKFYEITTIVGDYHMHKRMQGKSIWKELSKYGRDEHTDTQQAGNLEVSLKNKPS